VSQRDRAKLGDSKGAERLAALKAQLKGASSQPACAPTAAPTGLSSQSELNRAMSGARGRKHYLPPDAERAAHARKSEKKAKSKAPTIEILRPRSKEERALLLAAMAAAQPEPPPVPAVAKAKAYHLDFGEAAFKRLAPLRASLEGFVANHRGAADVPLEDQDVIRQRISRGAERVAGIVDTDNGYYLGYDFGTSTTKVVARNPYAGAGLDEAFALDVPLSIASGGQAHLFPTAVYWSMELDRFSLIPGEGYILLDSFKSALIEGRGHRICSKSGLTMAEAATAFLALHIAYCIGAALEENASFRLASLHVGIPVAVFDGQANIALFHRVVSAATRMTGQATQLSRSRVKAELDSCGEPALPYLQFAELAGAIAGYCAAPRFYLGGHMIIDCGSATLDIVTFDLDQNTNRPIGIYGASVENLGADACALYVRSGSKLQDCRDAVRYEEHLVFKQTLGSKRRSLFVQDNGRFPYQIILVGGGVRSEIHAKFLEQLAVAFEKPFSRPNIAPDLRYEPSCEPGRLILADGLARDPIDLRDIVLPRPAAAPIWKDEIAPGKDQV